MLTTGEIDDPLLGLLLEAPLFPLESSIGGEGAVLHEMSEMSELLTSLSEPPGEMLPRLEHSLDRLPLLVARSLPLMMEAILCEVLL